MAENMTTATGNAIHCNCGGTGQYTVHDEDGFIGAIATSLCPCRLNVPPREGQARWWTTESMAELEWSGIAGGSASASIDRERPVSEDNYRLIRTPENVYFPAMVNLQVECPSYGMVSEDLRSLARWLCEVADEVDRIDAEIS